MSAICMKRCKRIMTFFSTSKFLSNLILICSVCAGDYVCTLCNSYWNILWNFINSRNAQSEFYLSHAAPYGLHHHPLISSSSSSSYECVLSAKLMQSTAFIYMQIIRWMSALYIVIFIYEYTMHSIYWICFSKIQIILCSNFFTTTKRI